MLNKALEYLWKNTHCAGVKLQLYHFKQNGKYEYDQEMKQLLTERKFKWKKIVNNASERFEVLETMNKDYVDQMRQSKAQIYRRGLQREDVLKEPLTIFFSSMVAFGTTQKTNKDEVMKSFAWPQI